MLATALALALSAAPAPRAAFTAQRAFDQGDAARAAALLREALRADPEDLWLHWTWIRLASRPEIASGELELEYRALHRQMPGSPRRQLLLGHALVQAHGPGEPAGAWAEEASALIEGTRGAAGLERWTALAAAALHTARSDRVAFRKEIEAAWRAWPGDPVLAPAAAALARRDNDEARVVQVALDVAGREPRLVPRVIEGHVPPLDPKAEPAMARLLAALERAVKRAPQDVDVWISLYRATALADRPGKLAALESRIRGLEPGWRPVAKPAAGSGNWSFDAADQPLLRKFQEASLAEGEARVAGLEALLAEARVRPNVERFVTAQLGRAYLQPGTPEPRKAVELLKPRVDLDPGDAAFVLPFLEAAAESGSHVAQALALADREVARRLAQSREDPGWPRGGASEPRRRAELGEALAARGWLRFKSGDAPGAKLDLVLATSIHRESGAAWARLAEVEEQLGHAEDARAAWLAALAAGSHEESETARWRQRFDTGARGRYLWASSEEAVAAEKQRREAQSGAPSSPPRHPLIGKPAPDFNVARLGGGSISLQALKGRPVVVDFWATWCSPCRKEMPVLEKLHRAYKEKGVEFLVLSTDSEADWKEKVPSYITDNGYTMTTGQASEAVQSAYLVGGIPSLFIIGRDGLVKRHHLGYSPEAEVEIGKDLDGEVATPR